MSTQGFYPTTNGLEIRKDPVAQLVYTFDWSQWLEPGDSLAQVNYTINARINDPEPLVRVSQGRDQALTYVELSSGQLGKTYIVTAQVTTTDGVIDRRSFRVKVENRSA
jgi:hypothetical protein